MIKLDSKKQQYIKMTQTPMIKLITLLSLPTVVSMLVTAIYNMADTFFVSKLGTSASAAVGIVFPFMAVIQAVGFMIGNGAGSRISLFLGEGKNKDADKTASSAFVMSIIAGIILALICTVNLTKLLSLVGATDTILPYATGYAKYIILGFPIMCASFVMNNLLRAQGKTNLSMVGLTFGAVLNIILDPIFIFKFNMGISGAAFATIISQSTSFVILLYFISGKRSALKIGVKLISKEISTYMSIVRIGAPSFLRQGLASISIAILNNQASGFGDSAVAALTIVGRTNMLILSLVLGVGQGFQPVAGYNYGARIYKRVRHAFIVTLIIGCSMMAIAALIGFIYAPQIIAAFRPDDPEVISIGSFTLRVNTIVLPFMSFTVCTNMLHQALARSKEASFLAVTRQGVYFIPLILILPSIYGLLGVQLSQVIADILSLFTAIPFAIRFFKEMSKEEAIYAKEISGEQVLRKVT